MSARHTRRGFLAAHKLAAAAGINVPAGVAAGVTAEEPQAGADAGRDRPWYRISNATADEAELMLYDDIGGWYGTYAENFDTELKAVTAPKLTVRLNSPGGSVFEGMAIASMLRSHPADITVRVDGIAASIASVIAMAGDRVVMMPGATMMIHDASGMCLGDAAEMAKMAELLDKLSDNIADIYTEKAGGTRDEWRTRMRAESWYLAQEAVDAGLADEVAPARAAAEPAPEMRQAWDLKAYGYSGPTQPSPAPVVPDVKAVMRQFDEGDRVAVIVQHEPEHTQGVIAVVNGNAYGIIFDAPDDDTAPGEPYLWYVDNELQFVAEGADRSDDGEGDGYGPAAPAEEPLLPGVSHPGGVPTSHVPAAVATTLAEPEPVHDRADDTVTADEDIVWRQLTARLTEPAPDPWAELTSHLTTTTASPQRGDEA